MGTGSFLSGIQGLNGSRKLLLRGLGDGRDALPFQRQYIGGKLTVSFILILLCGLVEYHVIPVLLRAAAVLCCKIIVGEHRNVSELLTVYEDYLKTEKHASANTVSSYVRDVHQFAQSMEDSGVSLTEVLPKDVEGFTKSLVRNGKSPATVTRSVASIKSFYNCLIALGKVDRNPAKGVAPAKVERKLPQVLTGKEVELF